MPYIKLKLKVEIKNLNFLTYFMGVIHIAIIQEIFIDCLVHARHCATNWVFRAYRFQLIFGRKSS